MIALTPDQRQTVERKFRNLGTGREQLPGMVATKAQVVARSPDLATRPTEGLPSRLPPGDLRSRSRRGLETRAEPSPARNRQVIPGPFLSDPSRDGKRRVAGPSRLLYDARLRPPTVRHPGENRSERRVFAVELDR